MISQELPSTSMAMSRGDLDPRRVIAVAQGHAFEVGGRNLAMQLWTTLRLMVSMDHLIVLDTGEVSVRGGQRSATVMVNGVPRDIELTWGNRDGFALPVLVRMDGDVVFARTVAVMNWGPVFGIGAVLAFGATIIGTMLAAF